MRSIMAISFPRSGSSFMKEALEMSLGERIRWVDSHESGVNGCNYVKSHDFGLGVEVPEGWGLVVQYRDPIHAIPSWYDWEVGHGTIVDSRESWDRFELEKMEFWMAWNDRWMGREGIYIPHTNLIENPGLWVGMVLDLMEVEAEVRYPEVRPHSQRKRFRYAV